MNNIEAFEAWWNGRGLSEGLKPAFYMVWQAALASQSKQYHSEDDLNMVQSQAQQTPLVVWGYAWQCKSIGDWRIEKLGEGCIPPKDTLALYTIPPAPEGE